MSSSTSTSTSTSTSSTQPPLPLQHIYNSSNNSSHQNIINSVPFFTHLLSKLYVASHTLQLGTETRYAYFTLFHRCLSHYIHANINVNANANANANVNVNVNKYIPTTVQKEEIGNLAAASIFLACKLCNQQRRIRDVINVKHVLQFDQDTSTGTCTGTGIDTEERSKSAFRFQPPPLDEEYWKEKEEMVRVEQTLLRIISFDVNLSYPHRILVVLWEELVSSSYEYAGGGDTDTSTIIHTNHQQEYLKAWKTILNAAWRRLNDSVFHVDTLMCKASSLACASLSLTLCQIESENDGNGDGSGYGDSDDGLQEPSLSVYVQQIIVKEREWCEWFGVKEKELQHAKEQLVKASSLACRSAPKMIS
jgi:hypothetical protein